MCGKLWNAAMYWCPAAELGLTEGRLLGAAMIYGGSRRFWDVAHEYCKNGIGSHLEAFLPTVANAHNMKAVGLQVPTHPAVPRKLFQLIAAWFPSS